MRESASLIPVQIDGDQKALERNQRSSWNVEQFKILQESIMKERRTKQLIRCGGLEGMLKAGSGALLVRTAKAIWIESINDSLYNVLEENHVSLKPDNRNLNTMGP